MKENEVSVLDLLLSEEVQSGNVHNFLDDIRLHPLLVLFDHVDRFLKLPGFPEVLCGKRVLRGKNVRLRGLVILAAVHVALRSDAVVRLLLGDRSLC